MLTVGKLIETLETEGDASCERCTNARALIANDRLLGLQDEQRKLLMELATFLEGETFAWDPSEYQSDFVCHFCGSRPLPHGHGHHHATTCKANDYISLIYNIANGENTQ